MENKSHVIIAVSFIVVLGIGTVVFFFWLNPGQSATRRYQIITSQAVGGLHSQATVQFKGLKAGHVLTVQYAPNNPNKVQIVFAVAQQIPVTASTYAQLSTQGITGLKTLNLSNPNPDAKPLETSEDNPAQIPLRPGLLAQIKQAGKQDMQKVSDVLDSVDQLLSPQNRRHLVNTIAQIDAATQRLVSAEKAAQPALQQLPDLTRQMQATLTKIDRLADQAQGPVARAGDVEDSLQSLSASAKTAVRKLNYDTLPQLDKLINTMNQTAEHIDQLARVLKAKPQSVILGPPKAQPGPGESGFNQ